MIRPLKPYQKLIAYSALAMIAAWTVFLLFTMWVMLSAD